MADGLYCRWPRIEAKKCWRGGYCNGASCCKEPNTLHWIKAGDRWVTNRPLEMGERLPALPRELYQSLEKS